MSLETEHETFRRELPNFLREGRQGQFVLIKGTQVEGFFKTDVEAVTAGDQRLGPVPFLVKEVQAKDNPISVRVRVSTPCRK